MLRVSVRNFYRELGARFDPVPFVELDKCSRPGEQASSTATSSPRVGHVEPKHVGIKGNAFVIAVSPKHDSEVVHIVTVPWERCLLVANFAWSRIV